MLTTDGQRHDLPLDELRMSDITCSRAFHTALGLLRAFVSNHRTRWPRISCCEPCCSISTTGSAPGASRHATVCRASPTGHWLQHYHSQAWDSRVSPGSFTMGFTTPVICGISDRGSTTASLQYCRRNCSALRIKCMCQRRTPTATISPAFTHPTSPCRLPPIPAGHCARETVPQNADGCDASGQRLPFAKTRTARLAAGDPRPSLEERYPDHATYVSLVTAAAQRLEQERLLLDDDVQAYIAAAQAASIP